MYRNSRNKTMNPPIIYSRNSDDFLVLLILLVEKGVYNLDNNFSMQGHDQAQSVGSLRDPGRRDRVAAASDGGEILDEEWEGPASGADTGGAWRDGVDCRR